ncbi:hypothetical protein ETU09_00520 [Apibacter muscae]|uniref:Uncharacterized protein n=1 Tax=Apibacter muscae TaxID=2509004 RepID=A0A563DK34_9FLAO|nr:hypothetical protein [Apibacter muscae]TWP30517.1 hypothetical protein ETU09_00520 [Apibacter muscae]
MKNKTLIFSLAFLLVAVLLFALPSHKETAITAMSLPLAGKQLKNEVAEKELIKKFRHENTWLQEIKSKQNWVNNDVIKVPKQGAAPNVLINNQVYPIVSNKREDDYVTLSLNKYETENTEVTADELYALAYEKLSDVQVQHREELEDKTASHALYSISPDKKTAQTPILETTGDADENGRKKLTSKDVINLKKALDKLAVPKKGRVLVLCSDHVADLLEEDRNFKTQYQNAIDGVISKSYYGFTTYESLDTPEYNDSLEKLPFESLNTGRTASVAFFKNNTAKATGSVKRFMRAEEDDPEYRKNTLGFRLYFICVAIKDEGQAALVSGKAA